MGRGEEVYVKMIRSQLQQHFGSLRLQPKAKSIEI